MPSNLLRSTGALTLCAAAAVAQAQPVPPIKPGLWQVSVQRAVDGQATPSPGERLDNLPPEMRAKIEAGMKARGMELGAGGDMKVCHTKESLAQGAWNRQGASCKTDVKTRSAASWTWHTSCTKPVMETDGETLFTNAENYIVKTSSTMTMGGQARSSQNTITAKWLGADCGDVKPFVPPPAPK
ncbi:MAG TPA: DUF3617 domain-containing protein [Albitalea sp.]|nr:DUF3617 domain-containing protein [Albitalea sp.]